MAAVAALALGLPTLFNGDSNQGGNSGDEAAPTISITSSPSAERSSPPLETSSPSVSPTVLRSTNDGEPILLIHDGTVDFDNYQSPSWGASQIDQLKDTRDYDAYVFASSLRASSEAGVAIVQGEVSYDTCASATNYDNRVRMDDSRTGAKLCFLTTEGRYVFVTVIRQEINPGRYELAVTVWDPPVER